MSSHLFDALVGASSSLLSPPLLQNSNRNPLSEGVEYMTWEKSVIFDRNRHLS